MPLTTRAVPHTESEEGFHNTNRNGQCQGTADTSGVATSCGMGAHVPLGNLSGRVEANETGVGLKNPPPKERYSGFLCWKKMCLVRVRVCCVWCVGAKKKHISNT